jgi:hypothetical protein
MTSWRSTWKPNSLYTMASDPPAMNHPSDVLTFQRFVSDWLGFLLLCAALVHGKRNALTYNGNPLGWRARERKA